MKTFNDFINESSNWGSWDMEDPHDLNELYGIAQGLEKFFKQSGYNIAFKYSSFPDKGKWTSPIYVNNRRNLIKDRYCDINETRYEYMIEADEREMRKGILKIKIIKRWYEKNRMREHVREYTERRYEQDTINFLSLWFKGEFNEGCFDKGSFQKIN